MPKNSYIRESVMGSHNMLEPVINLQQALENFSKMLRSVNRPLPPLMAEKIINVQPLTRPTGLIYYLRYRYSKNKQPISNQVNIQEED